MKHPIFNPRAVIPTALVLAILFQFGAPDATRGGIECPCESWVAATAGVVFACPRGDGDALGAGGLTITVCVRNCLGPVPDIPASDIWLVGCNGALSLCGAGIGATGPTDANGQTTITGAIVTGGCDVGLRVMVQGFALPEAGCGDPCLPIQVRSTDQKGAQGGPPDGVVSAADFAFFGSSYPSPPKPYQACHDFVGGPYGTVTIADFARFGAHYDHSC